MLFYNNKVELWKKGERVNIGAGIYDNTEATKVKSMNVDIQPFSNSEAKKDYGLTVECTNIMYCDIEDIAINNNLIKYNNSTFEIVSVKKWDDYIEVILNEL